MFERRLKILLAILGLMVVLLGARAAQVQIAQSAHWQQEAVKDSHDFKLIDAARGTIYDCKGRVLAIDQPCTDACVDYRAIEDPPDPVWVEEQARARAIPEAGGAEAWGHLSKAQRKQLLIDPTAAVKSDIAAMWTTLAEHGRQTSQQMDDLRQQIVRTVWMRQHLAWYHSYNIAVKKDEQSDQQVTGWRKWFGFLGKQSPQYDDYTQTYLKDVQESHVILRAVDNNTLNYLLKNLDHFPGLELRPGTHRFYPYHDVACHILGSLARVDADDLAHDPNADNELRKYQDNDLKGSSGIEALCDPALRGTRGKVEDIKTDDQSTTTNTPPIPGHDVHLSIDIELQQQIESSFVDAQILDNHGNIVDHGVLHGACVVIDVKTGQVRALVSYPTFDLNTLAENYARLADDDLDQPLLNQATMAERPPGSTMKPMVGLAAISDGLISVDEQIPCNGYLVLDGHEFTKSFRCWTMSEYGHEGHDIPALDYADALQRSCDVYFETVGYRMHEQFDKKLGHSRLGEWEERFGLGRPTGIGIAEAHGRNLLTDHDPRTIISDTLFASTGQGKVLATPLQMANIAATIARNGIWQRPTLLAPDADGNLPAVRPGAFGDVPGRVDLHLPADALAAAHDGMFRVVNSGNTGTGAGLIEGDSMLDGYDIAGKTGTATATPLRIFARNPDGSRKFDATGKPVYEFPHPKPWTGAVDPDATIPWYRGTPKRTKPGEDPQPPDIDHAWYIGYAPAHHPQIAFAVMVEYGGGGGTVAASIARPALEACIEHGYLTKPTEQASAGGQ